MAGYDSSILSSAAMLTGGITLMISPCPFHGVSGPLVKHCPESTLFIAYCFCESFFPEFPGPFIWARLAWPV
eukprot:10301561-Ditylum_brightwellii.AAC.1